jgi:hypothetical protein
MDNLRLIQNVQAELKAKMNKNNKKTESRRRAMKKLRKEIEEISLDNKNR